MFNWLGNVFAGVTGGRLRRKPPHLEALAVHEFPFGGDNTEMTLKGSVYQQSPAVYIAVNRIAEAGALVPLKVYRLSGEQRQEVENHPLEKLLHAPNPYMSRFELFEQTLGFLELTGNAYWLISGDSRGMPAEIWSLRPDRLRIVPDPERYIRGYVYEIDGKQIPLDAVEVVHFKRWHPANDYYGLSALEAARLSVLSDRAMAQWNYNTFGKDNGIPAGIVSIKDFVNDGDFERIKQEWRSSYGAAKRRTAFVRGSSIEWQHIGLTHTDLDFLQGRKAHRDEILNIFGVPVGLVSENATEANAKVAERQFIERTLYPKLVRLAQKISQELLPFYPGEHIAEFEDIRPTDTQVRLAEIRTAQNVMSINEIRQKFYAMPPVAWGERPIHHRGTENTEESQRKEERFNAEAQRHRDTEEKTVGAHGNAPKNPADEGRDTKEFPALPAASSAAKSALEELAAWERFAVRRLEKGSKRAFEVRVIPDEVAFDISANLLFATDKDAVKAVFTSARETLAYQAFGEVAAEANEMSG